MKKILITGITGFVGNHLKDFLLKDSDTVELFGTTRSLMDRADKTFERVKMFNVELSNQKDVRSLLETVKPDEVYHLAALSSPADSFKAPTETITNNVCAQVNILEGLRQQKMLDTKILIITSSDVYGLVDPLDIPINEKTTFRPNSPYAVSKITQDYLALQYFLSYAMPIIRVRPFTHVGPKQSDRFVLASFAKQIAAIEKGSQVPVIKVGNLEARRDFTDVRDIVRAYVLLMEKGKPGDVYNVGSGISRKIEDVLKQILSLSTVSITVEEDPERMRPSEIMELCCDGAKMQALTGWEPEIPFDRTLEDILSYWREKKAE